MKGNRNEEESLLKLTEKIIPNLWLFEKRHIDVESVDLRKLDIYRLANGCV